MTDKNIIDFVIPWVDDSDSIWQEEFIHYSNKMDKAYDVSEKRYREWGIFKYWFRSVEEYAPWVNKIHLITSGHYPEWLDLNHPKINFVKHQDYIPRKYLPTFSANPIELNFHRIQNLSEQFVYFNDDIFLMNPVSPNTFFRNGKPCDSGVLTAIDGYGFSSILLNGIKVINQNFDKKHTFKSSPLKWFNFKYGKLLIRNILLLPWARFTGFYDYHTANSFLKSTLEKVWEQEYELLDKTSKNKFRSSLDVNQMVFRGWQLASNNFHPVSKHKQTVYYKLGVHSLKAITKSIRSSKTSLVCLNDHVQDDVNFESIKNGIIKELENKFPNKSSFEL